MTRELFVHLLPDLVQPERLEGAVAVVLDVLRASTTISHALAAGAVAVLPCGTVDEARRIAATFAPGTMLLGGERAGTLIEGFDLANSPTSFTPDVVAGKTIVFTTTNGTRALQHARLARRRLIGAFVNLNAVLDVLVCETRPIHLLCAGTDGRITLEDCLCAGAMAFGFGLATEQAATTFDDQTQLAIRLYENCAADPARFRDAMHTSRGGKNLYDLGLEVDIDIASRWDVLPVVPELMRASGQIQPATDVAPIPKRWLRPPGEPDDTKLPLPTGAVSFPNSGERGVRIQ